MTTTSPGLYGQRRVATPPPCRGFFARLGGYRTGRAHQDQLLLATNGADEQQEIEQESRCVGTPREI
jgi:hypothetical protein